MNRILLLPFALTLTCLTTFAQPSDSKTPQETAKAFTRQGDYAQCHCGIERSPSKRPSEF